MSTPKDRFTTSKVRRGMAAFGFGLACVVVLSFVFYGTIPETSHNTSNAHETQPAQRVTSASDTNATEGDNTTEVSTPESSPTNSSEGNTPSYTAVSIPSVQDISQDQLPEITAEHSPETVLVQLDPNANKDTLNEALARADGIANTQITEEDIALGFIELPLADNVTPQQALAQLKALPEVEQAQPNFIYHLAEDPSPEDSQPEMPTVGLQEPSSNATNEPTGKSMDSAHTTLDVESLQVNDTNAAYQWALSSVSANEAWSLNTCDKTVTVAIIDNGCLVTHEDLDDNIVATYNAVNGSTDVSPYYGGHGTHVAGIIAAEANNGTGVAGVSYNAGLLPIQVFEGSASNLYASSYSLARAYSYILQNQSTYNIQVVNMSLGATVEDTSSADTSLLDLQDALLLNYINKAYDAGILTVCAAGNDAYSLGGAYYNFPCDWLDNALGVIALQNTTPPSRAYYSNYNVTGQRTKNIAAPGSSILSTYTNYSSNWQGYYAALSGTSMASPYVAGVAALVYATNPALNAAEVADIICTTATDLGEDGWDNEYGYGEINAARAVELAQAGFYIEGASTLFAGSTVQLSPSIAGTLQWQSDDTTIATVSDTGLVTGVNPGITHIHATSTKGDTISHEIIVYRAAFSGPTTVQSGNSIELSFNVYPTQGSWSLSSSNESVARIAGISERNKLIVTGVSTGSVTITAQNGELICTHTLKVGSDTGSVALQASTALVSNSSSIASASISAIDAQWYTGAYITPKPVVQLGSKTLQAGSDYTLSYTNNKAVGTAQVIVTGKGNYTGKKSAAFKIIKRPSWAGATRLPLESTAAYTVSNGNMKIISGAASLGIAGNTLRAKKTGTAKLGLYDACGRLYATRTITIYKLSGKYVIQSAANTKLAAQIASASKKNNAKATVAKRTGKTNQKFQFKKLSDGTYAIKNVNSKKYLTVYKNAKTAGSSIVQSSWSNKAGQHWRISVDASNRLIFTSKRSGMVLGISGKATAGKKLTQQKATRKTTQAWVLK